MKFKFYGFTLIELLLVIAIVLIISGMTPVLFSRFLAQNSLANVADYIRVNMRNAQTYSMSGKAGSRWGMALSANKIILFAGDSFATRNTSLDQSYDVGDQINISGLSEVVFDRKTGTPSSQLSITLTSGENNRSIVVNSQGGID